MHKIKMEAALTAITIALGANTATALDVKLEAFAVKSPTTTPTPDPSAITLTQLQFGSLFFILCAVYNPPRERAGFFPANVGHCPGRGEFA